MGVEYQHVDKGQHRDVVRLEAGATPVVGDGLDLVDGEPFTERRSVVQRSSAALKSQRGGELDQLLTTWIHGRSQGCPE